MKVTNVQLDWHGPLAIPRIDAYYRKFQQILDSAGVYFYIQQYPEETVGYVGETSELMFRIQQHYSNFVGLMYYLRHDSGKEAYNPTIRRRNQGLDEIDIHVGVSMKEAKRLKFFFASCYEERHSVESALMNEFWRIADSSDGLTCDNQRIERRGWNQPKIQIENRVSQSLDEKSQSEARSVLSRLFGGDPIRWGQ